MEDIQLKKQLMSDARAEGICADGFKEMRGYDRDKLIDMYLRTIDWSLERNFPSLEMLRREFSDIEDKGVFVDMQFEGQTLSGKQTYVFHNCKGVVNVAMDYENAVIPMLYFANGCNIEVRCEQKNEPAIVVPVYTVDDGRTTVKCVESNGCVFRRYVIKRVKP